jgi:hypothetical protein
MRYPLSLSALGEEGGGEASEEGRRLRDSLSRKVHATFIPMFY